MYRVDANGSRVPICFPKRVTNLALKQGIEFNIELAPSTTLISKTLYKMALANL